MMPMNGRNLEPNVIPLDRCLEEYRAVVARFGFSAVVQPGRTLIFDWDLEYTCGAALANFIDQLLVRRLDDFLPDNDRPTILDCGANIGLGTLNYKRQFPNARIIAFEPDPMFAPLLRRNLERNGAGDVEVVEAAAWIRNGTADWYSEGIDGSKIVEGGATSGDVVSVRTVDLGEYLAEPVDLLKLDIEGAEYQLIGHLADRLAQVRNVLVECHLNQTTLVPFGQLLAVLAAAGFQVSVNSFGAWRDLIRQTPVLPDHWEQYLTVAGWRSTISGAATVETTLPYVGAGAALELRDARSEVAQLREEVGRLRSLVPSLDSREQALQEREAALLASLRSYVVGGGQTFDSRRLEPPFVPDGLRGWVVELPDLREGADSASEPRKSGLLLFEGEQMMGPAHSLHDDIRKLGEGRFSHWAGNLYFSTTDGSDPNANGRSYTVVFVNESGRPDLATREGELAARALKLDARERKLKRRRLG
ncbi:MAG: FkbM family methyltransferase [Thermoanaerobaculia bacterium]|nr:FkbM family methyltransferase [Thermoanaerobaculia bacterium]